MPINDVSEYKEYVQVALCDLNDRVTSPQIEFGIDTALDELGFDYPISDGSKRFWAIQRAKRHTLDLLRTAAAYKFKYKQIHLNQRFEQLSRLIDMIDVDFKAALESDPELFGVDLYKTFGTYLGNGFVYDSYGRDITRVLQDLGEDNEGYRYYGEGDLV